ncbi:MAG: amino acid adenylation domain-containing protein, partial [Acidobacteria bacterium]|nr:amino acid adenylation domain-containing protein [Acidobacteriota bacterium]
VPGYRESQNSGQDNTGQEDDCLFHNCVSRSVTACAALLFSFVRTGEQLTGNALYDSSLYKKSSVETLVKRYLIIFDWALSNSKTKLSQLEPATAAEKDIILNHFNRTGVEYPGPGTIHGLFEAAALRFPGNTAVIFEDSRLTYARLNETANQWAAFLAGKYLEPADTAAIMLESSIEMVIAILAILKSGGAYLPLEPGYPAQRIKQLLTGSGARVLVTVSSFNSLLPEIQPGIPVIFIDQEDVNAAGTANSGPAAGSSGSSLAYILYTSGTTGTPKGVMVEHKSLVNYALWRLHAYSYTSDDTALQVLSYVFDGFMAGFYTSLVSGGTLVMVPGARKLDTDYLKEKIKAHRVTNISLVPGLYKELIDKIDGQYLESLRFVVLAGEKADSKLIQRSREKIPGILHIIEYGPTETTVTATANIGIGPDETGQIGRPIANARVYILDDALKLMPVGIAGEIYIGGKGVSRGYLNNDDLTLKRFIPDPFAPAADDGKLYRTGDLGRWTGDGKIEFLGRVDRQVKIGGIRVEPGEIKNCLLTYDGVLEAEVLDGEKPDGNKYLYAFVVCRETITEPELRSYLGRHLPHYMVPAFINPVDKIPLTPNGKVDRKALAEMNRAINNKKKYDAPRNGLEQKLIDILQEVLGIERLGMNDNFFENGGDSIKAVQAAIRIQKLGCKVETADFFIYPVIYDLAKQIKPVDLAIHQAMVEGKEELSVHWDVNDLMSWLGILEGKVELTPIQQWFFEKNVPHDHYFNRAVLLRREKGFVPGTLEKLFSHLIFHHDMLRVVFEKTDHRVIQRNRGFEPGEKFFHLEVIDLTDKNDIAAEIETHAARIRRAIDYKSDFLMRLGLFKTNDADYLLIVLHYLIVDALSWKILLEDIGFGLQKLEKEEILFFREKTDSYMYWADRLMKYAGSYKLLNQLDYWQRIEKQSITPLPFDHEAAGGPEENRQPIKRDVVLL